MMNTPVKTLPIWVTKSAWQILISENCWVNRVYAFVNMINIGTLHWMGAVQINASHSNTRECSFLHNFTDKTDC